LRGVFKTIKIKVMESNNSDLRKFEKYVDEFYEEFKDVFKYDVRTILGLLLAQYDIMIKTDNKEIGELIPQENIYLIKGLLSGGLSHCFRWGIQSNGAKTAMPKDETAMKAISEFLEYGAKYSVICSLISPSHSNTYKYTIDFNKQEADFRPKNPSSFAFSYFQEKIRQEIRMVFDNLPQQKFINKFCNYIYDNTKSKDLFRAIKMDEFLKGENFKQILSLFKTSLLPTLPESTDLGGYTLKEFRIFYCVLYLIAKYDVIISERLRVEGDFFGILPGDFISSYEVHIESFKIVTGLEHNVVKLITKDLTFNADKFGSRVTVRPFYMNPKTNMIGWLPNMVLRGYPGVLIPNMLFKDKKKVYDKLINKIEPSWVNAHKSYFNSVLKNKGIELSKKINFTISNKVITPDIVLVNESEKAILIVEYKYFVAAYSIYDVSSQKNSVIKGFTQLNNYLKLFKQEFPGYKINGILLTQNPMTTLVELDENENVCIIDFTTMSRFINEFSNFDKIVKKFRRFFDLSNFELEDSQFELCNWNIKTQGISPKRKDLSIYNV